MLIMPVTCACITYDSDFIDSGSKGEVSGIVLPSKMGQRNCGSTLVNQALLEDINDKNDVRRHVKASGLEESEGRLCVGAFRQ